MTDDEVFARIASELSADTAWLRQLRWIHFRAQLRRFCLEALCSTAPVAGTWVLV
jgi:hypothetical protein